MNNRNGFAEAIDQLNTVVSVGEEVGLDVLEEAANYFVEKLRPAIPRGQADVHLQDELKVVVKSDMVQVTFSDKAWYWHLAEHGHKKAGGKGRVKGLHFVRNTVDAHGDKLAQMMADKIINRMEG